MELLLERKDVVWGVSGLETFLFENRCINPYTIRPLDDSYVVMWRNVSTNTGIGKCSVFWVICKNKQESVMHFYCDDGGKTFGRFSTDEKAINFIHGFNQHIYDENFKRHEEDFFKSSKPKKQLERKDVVWGCPGLEKFLVENGCIQPYEIRASDNHTFIVSWVNVEPSFYIFWLVSKDRKSSTVFEIERNESVTTKVFDGDEEAIEYLRKIKRLGYDFGREQYKTLYSYIDSRYGAVNFTRSQTLENKTERQTERRTETIDLTNLTETKTEPIDLTGPDLTEEDESKNETILTKEETKVLLNANPFLGQLQALKEKMQKREEGMDDLKKLEVLLGLARIEHELVGYLLVGEGKAELNDEYTRCVRSALDQARKICASVTSST